MGMSGMDWRNMFGGLMGGAAKDLGFADLYKQQLKPQSPAMNQPVAPDGNLMQHEMLHQMPVQTAPMQAQPLNAMGMFGNPAGVQPSYMPIRTYAYGGQLDPSSINIVSPDEAITPDGQVISTGDPEDQARRAMHEQAIASAMTQGQGTGAPPIVLGQPQTLTQAPSITGQAMVIPARPQGQIGVPAPQTQAPSVTGQPIAQVPLPGRDWSSMMQNAPSGQAGTPTDSSQAVQPPADDPWDVNRLSKDYARIQAGLKPTKAWKGALFGALQGFNNAANHLNNPIKSWDDVVRERKLGPAAAKLQAAMGMKDAALAQGKTAAETKKFLADADYQQERLPYQLHERMLTLQQKQQDFQNRLAYLDKQQDFKSGEAKKRVDEDGKVWKQFLKPDSKGQYKPDEPIINPDTGKQDVDPGEEMVDWVDPRTNKPIKIKAKQATGADSNIYAGDKRIQLGEQRLTLDEAKFGEYKRQFGLKYDLLTQAQQRLEHAQETKDTAAEDRAQKEVNAAQDAVDKIDEYLITSGADLTPEQKAAIDQIKQGKQHRIKSSLGTGGTISQ